MQTVSAALTSEQVKQDQHYYRKVELYRLYWNGSAYVWAAALDISAYVVRVSPAKWKLDRRGLNEWKSPSFQVEVDDSTNYFNPLYGTTNVWYRNGTNDYEVELTRVRVRCGQVLEDGTEVDLYVFGGVINNPVAYRDQAKQATLYVVGMDEILKRKSAEDLATTVTNEVVGADSGTTFSVANNGVPNIQFVVKKGNTADGAAGATELTANTDYTASQFNEKALPAQVVLATALTAGKSLWISYRYWYQDKDPSWVIEQLLILGGITSYQVDSTIFANNVENTWTLTSAADWATGTLTNVDATTYDGDFTKRWWLIDDFSDGDFTSSPVWITRGGVPTGWSVSGGRLAAAAPTDTLYTAECAEAVGTWETKMRRTSGYADFGFMGGPISGYHINPPPHLYYWVRIDGGTIYLYRGDSGTTPVDPPHEVLLISAAYAAGADDVIRVDRTMAGLMRVYVNGTLTLTYTDGTYTTATSIRLRASGNAEFDDIYYSHAVVVEAHSTATPLFESPIRNVGSVPTAWGKLIVNYDALGGSILVETYSSSSATFASGNDPAGWVAIASNGQMLSALLQYFKYRITVTTVPNIGTITGTRVQDAVAKYYTSSTTIPLVNCTGMKIWTAIQEVAKYPCYEILFSAAEKFYYRARSGSTTPVLTISASTNLKREVKFDYGTDRVINRVDGTFGDYRVRVDSDTQGEAHPNSIDKRGVKSSSISSSFAPAAGANISQAAALTVYEYGVVERKQAIVEMKFLGQYELGDPVLYERENKKNRWKWGDPEKTWGDASDPTFIWYGGQDNGWDLLMRVEGVEFHTEPKDWRMQLELAEIV